MSKKSNIHIKKENRGKFNATKARTGKSTEELTHSKNPVTRKRAIFAQNAAKWKHELGGLIESLIPDLPELKHGGQVYSEKVEVGEFKTPAQILKDLISSGKVSEPTITTNTPKQNLGGVIQSVAPLADLAVPGVGTGLSAIMSLFEKDKKVSNPFPMNQMKEGGDIAGIKQYNAPSHEMGGRTIDKYGNATGTNPVAEIEGSENLVSYSALPDKAGSKYVFSDKNGTSDMIRSIMDKYKNKDTARDLPTKAAMEMEAKGVEELNEAINNIRNVVKGAIEKRYGGVPKKELGDEIVPKLPNLHVDELSNFQLHSMYGDKRPFPYNTSMISENKSSDDFYTVGGRGMEPLDPLPQRITGVQSNQNTNVLDNTPGNQEVAQSNPLGIDLGSALRTAGLVASGLDAFQKPAVDREIFPDYSKSDERMNALNADLTQVKQDITGASNRGSELNRGAASSYSQYRARELSNLGNLQDQLGRVGLQEQQLRNEILSTQGQYEANKAVTVAGIRDDVQQRNLANKARTQDLRKQFFSDVVAEGDRLSTIKNRGEITAAKIEEGMQILKSIAPDFGINPDMVKNLIEVGRGNKNVQDLSDDELILFTRLNSK